MNVTKFLFFAAVVCLITLSLFSHSTHAYTFTTHEKNLTVEYKGYVAKRIASMCCVSSVVCHFYTMFLFVVSFCVCFFERKPIWSRNE